jgi:OOP family OmpA-OmpF porin
VANPASVEKGKCTTISWNSQNASSASIEPGVGEVPPSGSRQVCPSDPVTYKVTAKGPGGQATAQAAVNVTAPPPPPPPPPPAEEKLTVRLEVEFDTDKADVKARYHDEIKKVADFMQKYPTVKGTIEGHTDNVGSAKYNQSLSQRRADSIRKYLVEKFKVDPARLTAKGYGFDRPVADNATEEGRQKNRRTMATFDTVTIRK